METDVFIRLLNPEIHVYDDYEKNAKIAIYYITAIYQNGKESSIDNKRNISLTGYRKLI